MLTKKITGFSADLLNTVRGVLGEAKKCPADCKCEKCEAEEDEDMEEGYVPTADEPSDKDKKTADKVRALLAKEKKPVKEDAEQIDELSTKTLHSYRNKARTEIGDADANDDVDTYNKRVKGYSKAQQKIRTNFVKGVKEETEQLDELSKGTLGKYINKAAERIGSQGVTAGLKIAADEKSSNNFKNMGKRQKGIDTAVKKLTKEEQDFIDSLNDVEQIDELSGATLGSYAVKSKKDETARKEHGIKVRDEIRKKTGLNVGTPIDRKLYSPTASRGAGQKLAVKKLTGQARVNAKEEVEITEARGRPRKAGAKDFTIHPITKEKLMHNNPEHMAKIEKLQKNGVLPKPKTEAGQHIINQLRKASTSMTGGSVIHFTHGESTHVPADHARRALDKYADLKPHEKEDFQKKIGHSHAQMMKHI